MRFPTLTSPHIVGPRTVGGVMRHVLYALIPGTVAFVWLFGWGVLLNIVLAASAAVLTEALMLRLRGRPVLPFVRDNSALMTGWLLALCLPPLLPWWIPVVGSAFAVAVAKHLYGGLGYNPFNPAMVGYVVLLISFPQLLTQWVMPQPLTDATVGPAETLAYAFQGTSPAIPWDALTAATPLDLIKTELAMDRSLSVIQADPRFGSFGGWGWEWVAILYLIGGLWLLGTRVITWRIPVSLIVAVVALSTVFHLLDAERYPGPLFHVFSGAVMLGAFFIATDPVSSSNSPRGQLIYGAGIGVLIYIIRTWGGYPDGVAFGVLLMNLAVPTIDQYTQPPVFGEHRGSG
jgi:electron transport complex protein RnfD